MRGLMWSPVPAQTLRRSTGALLRVRLVSWIRALLLVLAVAGLTQAGELIASAASARVDDCCSVGCTDGCGDCSKAGCSAHGVASAPRVAPTALVVLRVPASIRTTRVAPSTRTAPARFGIAPPRPPPRVLGPT